MNMRAPFATATLALLAACTSLDPADDQRALQADLLARTAIELPANADTTTGASDDDVLALAAAELRRWTGTQAPFGLQKLHRFEVEIVDGALVEARQRLAALPARVPGLLCA